NEGMGQSSERLELSNTPLSNILDSVAIHYRLTIVNAHHLPGTPLSGGFWYSDSVEKILHILNHLETPTGLYLLYVSRTHQIQVIRYSDLSRSARRGFEREQYWKSAPKDTVTHYY